LLIDEMVKRWALTLEPPFAGDQASAAWVAPAISANGTRAVLKLAMPHYEGEQEIAGLRVWEGAGTVHVFEADEKLGAMLLERCVPGTPLSALPEPEQDDVVADLLRRLWRPPPDSPRFRMLAELTATWSDEAAEPSHWPDPDLLAMALRLFEALPRSASRDVLLVTDLHAGNVLRAEREPWLVIDPKPFVGDPAYDVTQHLFNCARLHREPLGTIDRLARLLGLDPERVRLWTFARAAFESREWPELLSVARSLVG
jgi:streptomycin 6-kinase